jgi:glycosyltransferase involved in cell wall biosynthesis
VPADDSAPPPALSILSAAHDAEPHLAEMIESVLAQTVRDWELIVVDDGMSDEVVRIVDKYPDDRIRLLRQEYRAAPARSTPPPRSPVAPTTPCRPATAG